MFADDASILISSRKNCNEFKNTFNMVISHIGKWFYANWLILNVDQMNTMKFIPSNLLCNPLTIVYDGELLTEVLNFKFLSLHIDKHLDWMSHIERLLPKLSTVCYTIRKISSMLNIEVLIIVYFATFQSLLEDDLIFFGKFFS